MTDLTIDIAHHRIDLAPGNYRARVRGSCGDPGRCHVIRADDRATLARLRVGGQQHVDDCFRHAGGIVTLAVDDRVNPVVAIVRLGD